MVMLPPPARPAGAGGEKNKCPLPLVREGRKTNVPSRWCGRGEKQMAPHAGAGGEN